MMLPLLLSAFLMFQQDDVDRQIGRLKARLDLTDEQEAKVREILKREADAKKESKEKILEVLTDEQKKKYEAREAGAMGDVMKRFEGLGKEFEGLGHRVVLGGGGTGKQLQKELELSDEQVKKIDELAAEHQAESWKRMAEGGGDWTKKMDEDHAALGEKIKPVLTDDQRKKFDDAWAQRSPGRWAQGGGSRGGDPVKRAMEALKIPEPADAAAVQEQVEKVVKARKELDGFSSKVGRRARDLAKDDSLTEEAIEKALHELRAERKALEKSHGDAQRELRAIISFRQELKLIDLDILR